MKIKLPAMAVILLLAIIIAFLGQRSKVTMRCDEIGKASWYGDKEWGRRTASGERFDPYLLTAAHRTLPLGTQLEVINLKNMRSVVVTINDRGPFKKGRVIDLSPAAAQELYMLEKGVQKVCIIKRN